MLFLGSGNSLLYFIYRYLKEVNCFLVGFWFWFVFFFSEAWLQLSPCFSLFQPCECSLIGALSSQCDLNTGCCFCRPEFSGEKCTECRLGYWNYPHCVACQCFLAGTDPQSCDTEGKCSCIDHSGQCSCKVGQ